MRQAFTSSIGRMFVRFRRAIRDASTMMASAAYLIAAHEVDEVLLMDVAVGRFEAFVLASPGAYLDADGKT